MTVQFKMPVYGSVLEIEMTLDGRRVAILNKDVEYDIVLYEFGEPLTGAIIAHSELTRCPLDYILDKALDIEILDTRLLQWYMLDLVEHVLEVYEDNQKDTYVTYAIEEARKFMTTPVEAGDMQVVVNKLRKLRTHEDWMSSNVVLAAVMAVEAAAVAWPIRNKTAYNLLSVHLHAMNARALKIPRMTGTYEAYMDNSMQAEKNWQLRRLLRLMQSRQNKTPFPALEDTK